MKMGANMQIVDWNPSEGAAFQGDISIIPIPAGIAVSTIDEIKPVDGRLIIQEGEVTNHHHAVVLDRPPPETDFAMRLRELLIYSSETGDFFWREWVGGTAHAGTVAGSPNSAGYTLVKIDGHKHQASRLAWTYFYGAEPERDIDHINGNRRDNRIANLREVTRAQNKANSGPPINSVSGVKGVFWNAKRRRWQARICLGDDRRQHLGYFNDLKAAEAAYAKAEIAARGEYAAAASRAATGLMADALANRITVPTARLFHDPAAVQALQRAGILTRADLAVGCLVVEDGPVVIGHDEHDGIRVPPGRYLVGRQIESAGAEQRIVLD